MVAQKRFIAAEDWRIGISDIAKVSFGLSLGGQRWDFFSPSLDYAFFCIVPRMGFGLSVAVTLPVEPGQLFNNFADQFLQVSQDHVTIDRPFSANSMDGGTVAALTVGARGVVAGADGHKTVISNNTSRTVATLHGGTVSLGLGVELDMGSLSMGTFYGPYPTSPPRQVSS